MPLSTQPYKGARDFYPEDKRLQKYMFNVLRNTVEKYGYEEYDAPILESLDLYLAKTGDEIVNEQTYAFEDRGGRKVAIRPEMTPTVSRMVAAKRQELAYPLRWYSIPNLWRYERPQRGRLREHWQLNVDIFGVANTSAETEMIMLVHDIFTAFGAREDMYEIRVNSRQLTDLLLITYLGLDEPAAHAVSKLIDRMHKMERSDFVAKVDEVLTPAAREAGVTEKLLAVLNARELHELPEEVRASDAYKELAVVLQSLSDAGITNARFDATLMRGFDYYTGIIFEVFDLHPDNNRSMLGGGRYDGLVGLFGVQPVPTVGFGWGDVTLQNFLELHHLLPELPAETELYVVIAGDVLKEAMSVAEDFRKEGVRVAVDLSTRKVGDQFKTADKKGVPYVVVVGETEVHEKRFTLKRLNDGNESLGTVSELAKMIKE
jgi:histidyl-tRNA synthetase